jgi:hypothetical protein
VFFRSHKHRADQRLEATVELDAESALRLDDPTLGLGLSGSDTAANVWVKFGSLKPWGLLADATVGFVQFYVGKAVGFVNGALGEIVEG